MNNQPSSMPFSRLPRSIAKCVDIQQVRDWVPDGQRRRVDLNHAWVILRNHFCAALIGRGVCPGVCADCREDLVRIFQLEKARNPEAYLTTVAKDISAKAIERRIAAQKSQAYGFQTLETASNDPFAVLRPKPEDYNPFLELKRQFEKPSP